MKPCQRCGTGLGPRPAGARGPGPSYCDACRQQVRREVRDRTRPPRQLLAEPPRDCVVCGATFTPVRRAQAYCSRKCRYHAIYHARKADGRLQVDSSRCGCRLAAQQRDGVR